MRLRERVRGACPGGHRPRWRLAALVALVAASFAGGADGARAAGCDTYWKGAADGSWTDPARWTNGVPSASDPSRDQACIDVAGDYAVYVRGAQSAGALTLDAPSGTPAVVIEGDSGSGDGSLSLSQSSFVGNGALVLDDVSGQAATLNMLAGTLTVDGILEVDPGGGGSRAINGDLNLTSFGYIWIGANTSVDNSSDWTLSAGQVQIVSGAQLTFGSGLLAMTAPTVTNSGSFLKNGGVVAQTGGWLQGNPLDVSSVDLRPSGGSGSYRLHGAGNVLGSDVGSGETVTIAGTSTSAALSAGAVNRASAGTINLTSSGAGAAQLDIANGTTLTNTGTIQVQPPSMGGSSERHLNGDLLNASGGSIYIGGTLAVAPGSDWTNNGYLAVVSNSTLDLSAGSLTNQSGTTLSGGEYFIAGLLKYKGAHIATNAAKLRLSGTAAQIEDETGANALAGFATNSASGTLNLEDGNEFTTGAFTNNGTVLISSVSGATLTTRGNYTQQAGTTQVEGRLIASGGSVIVNGGLLEGSGSVSPALQNNAVVNPAGPDNASVLYVFGDYIQSASATLASDIRGTYPGFGGYDQLYVFGTATLTGTLAVNTLSLFFTPRAGNTFTLVKTTTGRTGQFSNVTYAGGPTYFVNYNPGDVTLSYGGPTATHAIALHARATAAGVNITWRATDDPTTLGYNLYRDRDSHRTRLTKQLLAAPPGRAATYRYQDSTGRPGDIYRLEAVDLTGTPHPIASARCPAPK